MNSTLTHLFPIDNIDILIGDRVYFSNIIGEADRVKVIKYNGGLFNVNKPIGIIESILSEGFVYIYISGSLVDLSAEISFTLTPGKLIYATGNANITLSDVYINTALVGFAMGEKLLLLYHS